MPPTAADYVAAAQRRFRRPPVPDAMHIRFVQQGPEVLTMDGAERVCCSAEGCLKLRGCELPRLCAPLDIERGCFLDLSETNPYTLRDRAVAPVTLHVYTVGSSKRISRLSAFTQDFLKQGGIFHAGVEVYGREWSYGYSASGTGVFQVPPRSCGMHKYRESIYLGDCGMTEDQVFAIIRPMVRNWTGNQYDLLKHNCCFFSKELVENLKTERKMPVWVYKLAETGQWWKGKDRETYLKEIQGLHRLDNRSAAEAQWMLNRDRRP